MRMGLVNPNSLMLSAIWPICFFVCVRGLLPDQVEAAAEIWTTEAVLVEVGNALSAIDREAAVEFIQQCYSVENIHVVPVDTALLDRALALYEARADKTWGLTDCISFVVMEDLGLTDAVTADRHFVRAGYRALMRDR